MINYLFKNLNLKDSFNLKVYWIFIKTLTAFFKSEFQFKTDFHISIFCDHFFLKYKNV